MNYKLKERVRFIFLVGVCLCCSCKQNFNSGDLIFVASENSDFEKSIAAVTKKKYDTITFSHVGILNVTDTGVFVVEAVPEKGVQYSKFEDFKKENKGNKLFIGKLKKKYKKYGAAAVCRVCSHLGKAYDYAFVLNDDRYYCSELVYDAYACVSNNPDFFETPNMTFKKEGSNETLPFWIEYFNKLQLPIPEEKPGINPTALSHSKKLKIKNYK